MTERAEDRTPMTPASFTSLDELNAIVGAELSPIVRRP